MECETSHYLIIFLFTYTVRSKIIFNPALPLRHISTFMLWKSSSICYVPLRDASEHKNSSPPKAIKLKTSKETLALWRNQNGGTLCVENIRRVLFVLGKTSNLKGDNYISDDLRMFVSLKERFARFQTITDRQVNLNFNFIHRFLKTR